MRNPAHPHLVRPARSLLALLAGCLLCTSAIAAPVQGGYRSMDYPELGLSLRIPKNYEQVPLQPDERWKVLFFSDKPKRARTKKQEEEYAKNEFGVATLAVVWIDWAPDPEPKEGAPPAGSDRRTSASGEEKGPKLPITTIERFIDQEMVGWTVDGWQTGKEVDGMSGRLTDLTFESQGSSGERGFVYAFKDDARTIAFIGMAHGSEFDDQRGIWTSIAEKADIGEPEKPDLEKWIRYYGNKRYRQVDFRVGVRSKMVRGWEAEDLDDYIVVYHTKDQPLLKQICRNLEAIRKVYIELFPPAGELDAVSTVRICRDEDEYLRYAGLEGTAGYWNFMTEELVLYDAAISEKGQRPKDDNTFIILYHEAFHQYIYYSAGNVSPHPWYNEGFGDYFSGAEIKGGKFRRIDINPWRIHTIKDAVEKRTEVAWKDIIRYEQREYYANPYLCYAQGWSMIYFLNHASAVKENERWSRILQIYFDTIKRVNAEKMAALKEAGIDKEMGYVFGAQKEARDAAVDAAFEGVDLDAIHAAWREFVAGIDWEPGD